MTDEAKCTVEALRICHSHKDCRDCKFVESDKDEMSCVNILFVKSADLIESFAAELERVTQERDGLNILLGQAQSMLETRTRERDAAVEELKRADIWSCEHCKFNRISAPCGETNMDCAECKLVNCICKDCIDNSNWQWRGVQEEVWL